MTTSLFTFVLLQYCAESVVFKQWLDDFPSVYRNVTWWFGGVIFNFPHRYSSKYKTLTATRFSKVQSHQLNHVGFQQVNVPPRSTLWFRQGAGIGVEEGAGTAINGFLGNSTGFCTDLHGGLSSSHIQNWNRKNSW